MQSVEHLYCENKLVGSKIIALLFDDWKRGAKSNQFREHGHEQYSNIWT